MVWITFFVHDQPDVAVAGWLQPVQVDKFLAHHLDPSTADHVLRVTQSLGPLQRRREVEAYAFRGMPAWSNPCWPGIAEAASGITFWPELFS